jgi:hypothetical protein
MLLGVMALSLFVAILSPSTAGAKPQIEVEAVSLAAAKTFLKAQYSSPYSAFLELILPVGYYYIVPEPSISSQTPYDIVYQPSSGLDPIVATPQPSIDFVTPALSIRARHPETEDNSKDDRPRICNSWRPPDFLDSRLSRLRFYRCDRGFCSRMSQPHDSLRLKQLAKDFEKAIAVGPNAVVETSLSQ